ncbi:hypothetical protein ACLOJK_040078 [Asimina triloba]
MADQPKTTPTTQQPPKQVESPASDSHQAVKFVAAATIGAVLLIFSGIALTGTIISLVVATPLLLLFSPILVPAEILIFLVVSGFIFSGAFGVAAVSALSWIYNYVAGSHPPGSDQVDYARMRLPNKARDVKERAKEYGQYEQNKAPEATQAA